MNIHNIIEEQSLIFCNNILILRKKHKLTQAQMSELLGIGVKSLRSLEKGEIPPKLSCDVIFNIYTVFGIYPSEMFSPLEK